MKRYVLTSKIKSNPYQPVINYSLENLEKAKELVNNKDYSLILKKVDDDYFIVVGEDIFQASEKMGVLELEAIVLEKVDVEIMECINVKKLSSIEEAILYINIMNDTKLTQVQLAKKINKTQSTIANKIRLLNLQQEVQDGLIANKISERHGRSLLVLEGDQQLQAYKYILRHKLNVRESEKYIYELANKKRQAKKYLTKGFTRNVQIAVNSINQCLDMIKQLGIEVSNTYDDSDEEVTITITLPK